MKVLRNLNKLIKHSGMLHYNISNMFLVMKMFNKDLQLSRKNKHTILVLVYTPKRDY